MTPSRGRTTAFVAAAVVVVASIVAPAVAWAHYGAAGAETNAFVTHVLLAPGQPSCSGLGLLSVTLTWSQPSDHTYVQSYELGVSGTSGSGYIYTNEGLSLSTSLAITSGNHYYVVRSVNHSWRGALSPEQEVTGILFLVATCP